MRNTLVFKLNNGHIFIVDVYKNDYRRLSIDGFKIPKRFLLKPDLNKSFACGTKVENDKTVLFAGPNKIIINGKNLEINGHKFTSKKWVRCYESISNYEPMLNFPENTQPLTPITQTETSKTYSREEPMAIKGEGLNINLSSKTLNIDGEHSVNSFKDRNREI